MRQLRYTSEAVDNLADIAAYIATSASSVSLAEGFVAQLQEKCARLASLPGTLGRDRPELRPDLRSFAFKGYVIFFRYLDDTLEVVAILEGHRDVAAYFQDDEF
jgi:plasmid stabilization system protein ParE